MLPQSSEEGLPTWEPHLILRETVRKRPCFSYSWSQGRTGSYSQWSRQPLLVSSSSRPGRHWGGAKRDAEAPLQRRGGPGADTSVNPRPCSVLFLLGDLGYGSLSPGHLPGTADFRTECGTKNLVQQFLFYYLRECGFYFCLTDPRETELPPLVNDCCSVPWW